MGRPLKEGLDFFPLQTDILDDSKIRRLRSKFGPLGVYLYIHILLMVFKVGYYLEMPEDELADAILMDLGGGWIKLTRLKEIIHSCTEMNLFDASLMRQGVITSVSIQKTFIIATKRRLRVDLKRHWLLTDADMIEINIFLKTSQKEGEPRPKNDNDDSNLINVDNNSFDVNSNAQKEKKKEKEKKKDKKDKYDKGDKENTYGVPRLHFLTKCLIENKYINEACLDVLKYNYLFDELIPNYGFDDVLSVTNYIVKYAKRTETPIDDKFDFFKKSSMNNLERLKRGGLYDDKSIEDWFKEFLDGSNKRI